MVAHQNRPLMEDVVQRCCGLDVHQRSITACIMRQGYPRQIRTFDTTTRALIELRDWLTEERITHLAMESTGVYWKPVYNILDPHFTLLLVNARHIKHVPGRKTDVLDAEWICRLLRAGLLRGSFIPDQPVRRLRDLTRYRKKLQGELRSEKNRVHKLLQDSNVKLTSVLTDIFGKTGRQILDELRKGPIEAGELSQLFRRYHQLKASPEQAAEALQGHFTDHHRFLLGQMLDRVDFTLQRIDQLEAEVDRLTADHFKTQLELLQTIPGVQLLGATTILAEVGANMQFFPTAEQLTSWCGLCPGQKESAGVRASGRTRKGNTHLKTMLVECAWCAVRTQDTYLRAKYYKILPRLGKRKAMVVIAHKLLIAVYYVIRDGVPYRELTPQYLDQNCQDRMIAYHLKQLHKLGVEQINTPLAIS